MPKASDIGETPRTGIGGKVPIPVALTVGLPAELATVMVAVFEPVVVGPKTTLNVWFAPAAMLNGVEGEVTLKSVVLLFVIPVTLRLAEPVFDIVTVCAAELLPVS